MGILLIRLKKFVQTTRCSTVLLLDAKGRGLFSCPLIALNLSAGPGRPTAWLRPGLSELQIWSGPNEYSRLLFKMLGDSRLLKIFAKRLGFAVAPSGISHPMFGNETKDC